MKLKKHENKLDKLEEIKCPNCNAEINIEELGLVMFKSCTVFSCPVCEKTIAIQPKGNEFSIEVSEE